MSDKTGFTAIQLSLALLVSRGKRFIEQAVADPFHSERYASSMDDFNDALEIAKALTCHDEAEAESHPFVILFQCVHKWMDAGNSNSTDWGELVDAYESVCLIRGIAPIKQPTEDDPEYGDSWSEEQHVGAIRVCEEAKHYEENNEQPFETIDWMALRGALNEIERLKSELKTAQTDRDDYRAIIARTPTPKSIGVLVCACEKVLRHPSYSENFDIACDELKKSVNAMIKTIGQKMLKGGVA